MSVSIKNVSKNMILVFLLCRELKLDFDECKILFLKNESIFWKFWLTLLSPKVKMTSNRFNKLNNLAIYLHSKIDIYTDKIDLTKFNTNNKTDTELAKMFVNRIKNKFECNGTLYNYNYFCELLKENNRPLKITLIDGTFYICKLVEDFRDKFSRIEYITINCDEYTKTSSYKYYKDNKGSV